MMQRTSDKDYRQDKQKQNQAIDTPCPLTFEMLVQRFLTRKAFAETQINQTES